MLWFLSSAFALEAYQEVFNKAAIAMNSGDPDGCMKTLSSEGREFLYLSKFQDLGYICASRQRIEHDEHVVEYVHELFCRYGR